MFLLLKYTLLYTVVLMMVALGGMFSERSGIINIALEGIMVIGGLMGVIAIQMMPAGASAFSIVLVSVLAAGIAGMLYAGLLAFASINLNADQTIGGTALNLLATALAMVIAKGVNHSASAKLDYSNRVFVYDFGPLTVNVFLFIGLAALILSYIVLYKTRLGLRLRACGEHPQAADSVGINVYKMRYIGVLISGVLGGIGGMAYIIPSVSSWNFEVGVSGAGFLALAVMIFGQWKPFRIFLAAVFFALFKSLANIASSIPFLADLGWTQNMYNMIPFIASMIILAFTSKKSRAPKAEGIPYDKGSVKKRRGFRPRPAGTCGFCASYKKNSPISRRIFLYTRFCASAKPRCRRFLKMLNRKRIRFFVLTRSEVRRTGGTLNGTRQSQSEKDGARIKPF